MERIFGCSLSVPISLHSLTQSLHSLHSLHPLYSLTHSFIRVLLPSCHHQPQQDRHRQTDRRTQNHHQKDNWQTATRLLPSRLNLVSLSAKRNSVSNGSALLDSLGALARSINLPPDCYHQAGQCLAQLTPRR